MPTYTPAPENPSTTESKITFTPDNLNKIRLIRKIGRGNINSIELNPKGELLAIGDESGFWVLDINHNVPYWISYYSYEIKYVSWSSDGEKLLTVDPQKGLLFWDIKDQKLIRIWEIPKISGPLQWSPDGTMIAFIDQNHHLQVWNVEEKQRINVFSGFDHAILGYYWNQDNNTILIAGSKNYEEFVSEGSSLVEWNIFSDETIFLMNKQSYLISLFPSKDGEKLAINGYSPSIKIYNTKNMSELYSLHNRELTAELELPYQTYTAWRKTIDRLVWSKDGAKIFGLQVDGTHYIWDANHGNLLKKMHYEKINVIHHTTWSEGDNAFIVTNIQNRIFKLDVDSGLTTEYYNPGWYTTESIDWSSDGLSVAIGQATGEIVVFDPENWNEIFHDWVHESGITDISWSPDNQYLASLSNDNSIKLYHAQTKEIINSLDLPDDWHFYSRDICWSPDSQNIYLFSPDGILKSWNIHSNKFSRKFEQPNAYILAMAWSPDGQFFAYGGSKGIWIRDKNFRIIKQYTYEDNRISAYGLAWSPDNTILAFTDRSNMRFISTDTWKMTKSPIHGLSLTSLHQAHWVSNNKLLISPGYMKNRNSLFFWDTEKWQMSKTIKVPPINIIEISPAGDRFITADGRGTIYVYGIPQ